MESVLICDLWILVFEGVALHRCTACFFPPGTEYQLKTTEGWQACVKALLAEVWLSKCVMPPFFEGECRNIWVISTIFRPGLVSNVFVCVEGCCRDQVTHTHTGTQLSTQSNLHQVLVWVVFLDTQLAWLMSISDVLTIIVHTHSASGA